MIAAGRRVAVIGLGIMGGAIARNLAARDFSVSGYDIDVAARARAGEAGIAVADSAVAAARGAAIVLISLPTVAALEATAADLAADPPPGLVAAELSTFPIAAKEAARERLADAGITLLDCPLSGTGAQAVTGDLVVFASGDEAAFDRARDVFGGFARACHYLGTFGNGSRMKFVANLLVAVHNVASAEAMVLGAKAGLDPRTILDVIRGSAGNSRIFELRGPMMADRRYEPATMRVDLWQKDMAVIAAFARDLGVDTPTFSATAPLYSEALAEHGAQDVAAVHALLRRRAKLD